MMMRMMKSLLCFFVSSFMVDPALASPASELPQIIRCHEALDGKSEGHSEKLDLNQPTPIALVSGKKILFVTEDSVYSLDKIADADMIVRVETKNGPLYRKLGMTKEGAIGRMSTEVSPQQRSTALQPRVALDDGAIEILKKELALRMKTVPNQYQNKYDPAGVIKDLQSCQAVNSHDLQKNLNQVLAYYQKMATKKSSKDSYHNQDQ